MSSLLSNPADLLRAGDVPLEEARPGRTLLELALLIFIFGIGYGAVMGTYGSTTGIRVLQMTYSAAKVPLLLLSTFLIGLPSFFVLNTLLGLRDDFGAALRALVATQAGLTIVLCSLAPFTALWYVSTTGYREAILFNAGMFAVASIGAQMLLKRFYRPLIEKNRKHLVLLRIWLGIYAFVGIQMGWLLRPFIGDPNLPTRFFREDTWGNAYVIVGRMIRDVLMR